MIAASANEPARTLLAFDFGLKRIGVAVASTATSIATEVTTIDNNPSTLWRDCDVLVKEWKPGGFVVGLPTNNDGTPATLAQHVRVFGNELLERYQKDVYYHDEHLTSHAAEALLQQSTPEGKRSRNKKRQSRRDQIAARLILEGYLDARR